MLAAAADIDRFEPDPGRAAGLDARVRKELANSLATIFATIDDIRADEDAARELIRATRDHPIRPGVFGLYTELVETLFADDIRHGQLLVEALLDREWCRPARFRTVTLDDAELGAGQAERYRRLLDDAGRDYRVEPVAPDLRARTDGLLAEAMELLDTASPALAGEIRALVSEIVLVDSRPDGDGRVLDGAFSFYLWGALFMNAVPHVDRLSLACALAHESAHAFLLGVTLGDKLVENPDDELYPSPLRRDPRPMDGLAHATYVLARMVFCLRTLIASGALTTMEAERAAALLARHSKQFWNALDTVLRHARFTPEGGAVFGKAQAYMEASDRHPSQLAGPDTHAL